MGLKDRAARNAYGRAYSKKRAEEHRRLLARLKAVPCADCGRSYPPYVMDFDHVRGEKLFEIGLGATRAPGDLLAEIDKCEVVCANCHRERTHARKP